LNKNTITRNLALIVVFTAVGIVLFTENIRTVQILGLFACGAVAGASLTRIIDAIKTKKETA